MNLRELKIGLMLFLIFCTGGFTGVLLDRKFAARTPIETRTSKLNPLQVGDDAAVLAELTRQMKLTPDQQKQVGEILRAWAVEVKQSRTNAIHHHQELFNKATLLIRAHLTQEQIPVLDDLVQRSHRRQRQQLNRMN